MTAASMSSVPLMASFTENKPSLVQPKREELVKNTWTFAAPETPASEAGRKALEDEGLSLAEINRHKSDNDAWIVVDGFVYDITRFLDTHPGGIEIILEHLHLKDAGKLMRGEEVASLDSHPHSKYAFRMLQQFRVGRVRNYESGVGQAQSTSESDQGKYTVDLTKPLVFQVGHLGADYDRWVHDPVIQKQPPRFFENDIAEFFTQTAWWVIPAVWGPLVMYLSLSAHKRGLWLSAAPFTMAAGAFIWTFIEYLLHRFFFHMKTSSYWTNTLHYFLHGFHHKFPMDGSRLVFPPVVTAIIVAFIWYVTEPLVSIVGRSAKSSMFSGALLMYTVYDLTHYFLHFGTPLSEMSRNMKELDLSWLLRCNLFYGMIISRDFI